MSTTIQISNNTKQFLDKMKMFERETYNDVIEKMIEDNMELNEKTKRDIEEARKRVKRGEFFTQAQVEKMMGL